MTLDDFKASWQTFDVRLQSAQLLNQQLLNSMIGERSRSRMERVKRQHLLGGMASLFWLGVCAAILAGNPFDFRQALEYAPIVLLAACLAVLLGLSINAYSELQKADFSRDNLFDALKHVVAVYQRSQHLLRYTVFTLFLAGLLFPLSFLPRKLERMSGLMATLDTLAPVGIALVLYAVAYTLGAFTDVHGKMFKRDLAELEELRALSEEMA